MKKAKGLRRFEFELDSRKRVVRLPERATVASLLEKLGQSSETLLATIDGKLVSGESRLKGRIKLFRVVSGG